MYSLILKDILIQKKMLLLSFVYIVFFFIVMQGTGFVLYPTALTAITYMLVVSSCAYDDKNKVDLMLNSLPVKRTSIVLAKYLTVFIYAVACTITYLITTTLIYLTRLPVQTHPVTLEGLAGGVFAISLIMGIYFPVYFKLGYVKSRFLNLILFFTFFFGLTSFVSLYHQHRETSWAKSLQSFWLSQSDLQIFILFMVFILMMLAVSITLSLKAYQSRQF